MGAKEAGGGDRGIKKPVESDVKKNGDVSRFELDEINHYEKDALRAKIRDTLKEQDFFVDVFFEEGQWKIDFEMRNREYSMKDLQCIERIIQNAMHDEIIKECSKLGLEILEVDYLWNTFLFKKIDNADSANTLKAKLVNTGIKR